MNIRAIVPLGAAAIVTALYLAGGGTRSPSR